MRRFGKLVPLRVVRQRYLRRRFGKFRRLKEDGCEGKSRLEERGESG